VAKKKSTDENVNAYAALFAKHQSSGDIVDVMKVDTTIPRLSTGMIGLDFVLGGGWPTNRLMEIYGANGVCKTTLVCLGIAEFQKHDERPVLLIDAEGKIDLDYAVALGVDLSPERLVLSQSNCIETVTQLIEDYAAVGVSSVWLDSLAGFETLSELTKGIDGTDHGQRAKKIGQMLRIMAHIANNNNTFVCFTNQIRTAQTQHGSYTYSPGGNAKNHHAAIIVKVSKVSGDDGPIYQTTKEAGIEIGHAVEIYAEKNQTGRPHKRTKMDLIWGVGFNCYVSLVRIAVFFGTLKRAGSWFTYEDQKLQGEKTITELFASDVSLYEKLYQETLAAIKA